MAVAALTTADSIGSMLDAGAPVADIGGVLDELEPAARWDAVAGLGLAGQRKLYDAAADAAPLTLEDFVPASVPDLTPVRHVGRNTLPLPGLNRFAKVFTRQPNGRIVGYNDSPIGFLIGPGYYTAVQTPADWADRGKVVIDYYQPPSEGPVPEGWPWLRPNWLGIQFFVYFQTRDFMRRVSSHVTIGAAYKWSSTKMDQYFLLCREDG